MNKTQVYHENVLIILIHKLHVYIRKVTGAPECLTTQKSSSVLGCTETTGRIMQNITPKRLLSYNLQIEQSEGNQDKSVISAARCRLGRVQDKKKNIYIDKPLVGRGKKKNS